MPPSLAKFAQSKFPRVDFNPDAFRMSVGDHLEELRSRLIKALVGVVLAFAVGLVVAKGTLLPFVAAPMIGALKGADVTPQLFYTSVTDPFFVYLKLASIAAFVVAGPWVLWQGWGFIASGLYPHERKAVTGYLPLSLGLFFGGIYFAWKVILPITLAFFLGFGGTIPLPQAGESPRVAVEADVRVSVPTLAGDPVTPLPNEIWYDAVAQRLKMNLGGQIRVIPFGPQNLAAPIITLPQYVSLVLLLLVVFGLSFQMPLVVTALIRTRLVEADTMRQNRRYIYFGIVIAACVITPGDVLTATLGLLGPLILLFELGLWLGERGLKRSEAP